MLVTVMNTPIELLASGSGTPTLLLHGVPDSGAMWRSVIECLPPGARCLAPDLPGQGQSGTPAGFDFSLDAMARFVDSLVDALGIDEPLNLVGHDFGGIYGMAWAVRSPTRVRTLAVTNTNFFSNYRWHIGGQLWRTPIVGELSMAMLTRGVWRGQMQKISPALPASMIDAGYASIKNPSVRRTILRLYRATDPANFRGWEDALLTLMAQVPSCVLWGDRDPFAPPQWAERFGARQVVHFADYGHWLPVEAPAPFADQLAALWSSAFANSAD